MRWEGQVVCALCFDYLGAEVMRSGDIEGNASSAPVSRRVGYEENGRRRLEDPKSDGYRCERGRRGPRGRLAGAPGRFSTAPSLSAARSPERGWAYSSGPGWSGRSARAASPRRAIEQVPDPLNIFDPGKVL
ncbi:hypothetical protein [Lapillicoccus sp.]|uniref:hypothetical protein n=1 Tax=Lapillicoccus sp. TaxID=1909287 RepID=UPI003262D46B